MGKRGGGEGRQRDITQLRHKKSMRDVIKGESKWCQKRAITGKRESERR